MVNGFLVYFSFNISILSFAHATSQFEYSLNQINVLIK